MSADQSYFGLKLLAASMLLGFVGGCGGGGGGGGPDGNTGNGSENNVNTENLEPEYIPPPDLTAPNVVAMTPSEDSAGIATNSRLTVTFSEAMTPSDIDTRNFRLTDGVEAISGIVSFDSTNNIARFTPTAALVPNKRYTATVVTGIKDLAGNAFIEDFAWCFTTDIDATEDRIAPTMTFTLPANALTGVPFNRKISATFSEPMNSSLLIPANFKLVGPGATAVAGTVTYVDTTAIFTPASALAANTTYTATITAGVTDLTGNAVGADQSWGFTTGANADSTAPGVLSTIPANIASDVAISSAIKVTFNEPVDPATITTANFLVTAPDLTAVIGTVAFDAATNTATFTRINHTVTPVISHTTPVSELEPDTTYTATVTTGVKDMAGNPLASDLVWKFTTGAAALPDSPGGAGS